MFARLDTGGPPAGLAGGGPPPGAEENVRVQNVVPLMPDRQSIACIDLTAVAAAGDGQVVAAGAGGGSGVVVVYDVRAGKVVAQHARHKGAEVTAVVVDPVTGRVCSADSTGLVVIADVLPPSGGAGGVGGAAAAAGAGLKSLFKGSVSLAASLASAGSAISSLGAGGGAAAFLREPVIATAGVDAPAVQLSLWPAATATAGAAGEGAPACLLVSTTTRTVAIDLPPVGKLVGGAKLEARQLGKKPREAGMGAAFDVPSAAARTAARALGGPAEAAMSSTRIAFAARPGRRVWAVDAAEAAAAGR
jgi:hypothetical protein